MLQETQFEEGKSLDFGAPNETTLLHVFIQCEAPKIAKLVYNSNNYGLW